METKISTNEKLIRKAARGLIGSTLTDSELEVFAIALLTDNSFSTKLANAILAFLEGDTKKLPNSKDLEFNSFSKELVSEIKRKRLSKATFAKAVQEFSPSLAKKLRPELMSMDEMIEIFCKESPIEKQSALKDFISNGNSSDPYLLRILSKKQ